MTINYWSKTVRLKCQELIEKTRERQASSVSEISWAGRVVPVKNEQVRVLLLSMEQNVHQLAEMTTSDDDEHKLSLYESTMKALVEAQQIIRDEHKDDPVGFRNTCTGSPCSSLTLLIERQKWHTACRKPGIGNLVYWY